MNEMYIVSFNSTHHAIRLDKLLGESSVRATTLPTPREITASCGISIRFLDKILSLISLTGTSFTLGFEEHPTNANVHNKEQISKDGYIIAVTEKEYEIKGHDKYIEDKKLRDIWMLHIQKLYNNRLKACMQYYIDSVLPF